MTIETTPDFWDCECEHDYIRPKSQLECPLCHAHKDEQPDSRVSEVEALLSELTKYGNNYTDAEMRFNYVRYNPERFLSGVCLDRLCPGLLRHYDYNFDNYNPGYESMLQSAECDTCNTWFEIVRELGPCVLSNVDARISLP